MKQGNAYGTGVRAAATKLHSKIIRSRGSCERCGSTERLECAHIVSRSFAWTRTDLSNAWCLCSRCHFRLTNEPYEHVRFAIETRGVTGYDALRLKAREGVGRKMRWDEELERLRAIAREMELI